MYVSKPEITNNENEADILQDKKNPDNNEERNLIYWIKYPSEIKCPFIIVSYPMKQSKGEFITL